MPPGHPYEPNLRYVAVMDTGRDVTMTSSEVKRNLGRLLEEVARDGLRIHVRRYTAVDAVLVPSRWYEEVSELVGDLGEP